ncbi:conserved hypothetical protein [Candidatus Azobacteroides pseudotrichonymphae genomovar. CFP2]|uniref:DUF805 domain-containing protein n=2 Tax=Candidatus Azobacteroides TaxID=511434 RepID=B6YRW9_AZOPC|nr:DUF805 domain-containing protein [Candidatus Azobacteroides pseudotrichonymphae]BAG83941.1 conserved hypothetical protein [Candidatus Azobacteroides pseudotrichonymphae genomovar. CFP2]
MQDILITIFKTLEGFFSFRGRISRREFIMSFLTTFLGFCILGKIEPSCISDSGLITEHCFESRLSILWIILFWFMFAQRAKRCHDVGHSGWWQFIPLYELWLLYAKGQVGKNEYGEDPQDLEEDLSSQKED